MGFGMNAPTELDGNGSAASQILVHMRGGGLFVSVQGEPRSRRATDLILLLAAVAGLVTIGSIAEPQPGFLRGLAAFLLSWPTFLTTLWQVVCDALVVLALALVLAAFLRRRFAVARDLVLAALTALFVATVIAHWVSGGWPDLWEALRRTAAPSFPALRVAAPAAVVLTAAPHVIRPVRRVGSWAIALACLATVMLGAATPLGVAAAVLAAAVAGATIHLLFGSAAGRPALGDVGHALAELGLVTTRLGAADRQQAGLFTVEAVTPDNDHLVVKVYGRDARDTALLSTVWRAVWLREPGARLRLGRLQQVEHEAFLTLLAGQAGVRTDRVVITGVTGRDDALLVLSTTGVPLDHVPTGEPAEVMRELWEVVRRLEAGGMAHGQLDAAHLVEVDGEIGVVDFRAAAVAPSASQRHSDKVQALVTAALWYGVEPAVTEARHVLRPDELTALLPLIQPAVLTSSQRRALRAGELSLDELRSRVAASVGTEAPKLAQLRRVTLGSILRVLLPAVALVALVSQMSGIAWDELGQQLRDATWWLVALAFLLTQVPRVTQAVSTLGASPVPLPLGPVYALQLSVSYVNLAVPTSAARMAVNVRFFQRHGVQPAAALTAGAIDGFVSFLAQSMLLIGLLLLTPASLDLDLTGSLDTGMLRIAALVVVLLAASVGAVLAVPKWRRFVVGWARQFVREAIGALRGLRSPRRLALLVGGSVATEVLFAAALALFARALGFPVGLGDALLINISVALLAGLMPVPGGIGLTEAALTVGLVRAGLPDDVAFAAALLYRMSGFYLPPIWGWFALRWLQRNQHL